ncbi:Putative AC9 transposase [Linum perenne]
MNKHCTVASESAFSLGGRIMTEFRTSLTPSMLEALVCAADWLRSGESAPIDEEDVPEEEQEREYRRVLNQIGLISFNVFPNPTQDSHGSGSASGGGGRGFGTESTNTNETST